MDVYLNWNRPLWLGSIIIKGIYNLTYLIYKILVKLNTLVQIMKGFSHITDSQVYVHLY